MLVPDPLQIPKEVLLEQLLPLWHLNAKKEEERCYVQWRSSVRGGLLIIIIISIIIVILIILILCLLIIIFLLLIIIIIMSSGVRAAAKVMVNLSPRSQRTLVPLSKGQGSERSAGAGEPDT